MQSNCWRIENEKVTTLHNKEMLSRKTGNYHKRPDINIEQDNEIAYIIDVTIVKNDRERSAYSEKANNYRTLAEKVRNDGGVKKVIIVPVVVTIKGTINKFTIQKLIECEINIK